MLQSKPQQLLIKYMTSLRLATELRPEDIGSIRMAMSMALSELQDEFRQQLNDMDDIIADLLQERAQLRATAGTDADEILRLQTMEDRLTQWVSRNAKVDAGDDIADVVIDLLSKAGGADVAPPATNGHTGELGERYNGRRLNVSNDELRLIVLDYIRMLAGRLGHTPTKRDWARNMGPNTPSLPAVTERLHMTWNELVAAAGLEPNQNIAEQKAAQKADEEEAQADDSQAPFRDQ